MDKETKITIHFTDNRIEAQCENIDINDLEQAIVTLTELYEQVEKNGKIN